MQRALRRRAFHKMLMGWAPALLLAAVLVWFLAYRWLQRLEPWDSDDMTLFGISAQAAEGRHWVFGTTPEALDAGAKPLSHQALRIGLLPLSVPVISALGPEAYHVVPLAFALLGFLAVQWILFTHFGPLIALVFAAIHVAWPLELSHSSIFLVDLPSAAAGLWSLCLLEAARRSGSSKAAWGWALLAGLCGVESHLLRSNTLPLLAPAYGVFLWSRETRRLAAAALGVIALGLVAEQLLFYVRGLGVGYGWMRVRSALDGYSPFLSVYSWFVFLTRQFRYQLSTFGVGVTGALATLVLLGSLAGHAIVLRFERRPLLLATVIYGGLTWLVFSFAIYELVDGGVRAMAPPNTRYIQAFQYSSLIVGAWIWCAIRKRLAARPQSSGPAPGWRPLCHLSLVWALPLVLLSFSYVASARYLPPRYRESDGRRLFSVLKRLAQSSAEPVVIAGIERGLRIPQTFCCGSDVEWRPQSAGELRAALEHTPPAFVLRNPSRELARARYLDPEPRREYREQLAQIDEQLWEGYEIAYLGKTFVLFGPRRAAAEFGAALTLAAPAQTPGAALLLGAAACPEGAGAGTSSRVLEPPRRGVERVSCAYSSPGDALALPQPAPRREGGRADYVLRLEVEYEHPTSIEAEVVEYDGERLLRRSHAVPSGASYVPVPVHQGTRALFVVYRVTARGGGEPSPVRLHPARWRSNVPRE